MKTKQGLILTAVAIVVTIAFGVAQQISPETQQVAASIEESEANLPSIPHPLTVEEALAKIKDIEALARERRIMQSITESAETKQARDPFKDRERFEQEEIARYAILNPAEFKEQVDQTRDAESKRQEALANERILHPERFARPTDPESIRRQEAAMRAILATAAKP